MIVQVADNNLSRVGFESLLWTSSSHIHSINIMVSVSAIEFTYVFSPFVTARCRYMQHTSSSEQFHDKNTSTALTMAAQ